MFNALSLSRLAHFSLNLATASMLGLATCWYVAANVGPRTGRAFVHVTEANVVVNVGGVVFQVEERIFAPLVCELPAGEHRLVMSRGSTELYSEVFTLREGAEAVLATARPLIGPGPDSGSKAIPPMK
jgi:hypothetical protein